MRTPTVRDAEAGGEKRAARIRSTVTRHPAATAAIGLVVAGALAFVLIWFEPWQLFVDRTVNEALPEGVATGAPSDPDTATGAGGATASPAAPAAGPTVLSSGRFRSLEHETTGTAKVIELADGSHIVRFEDLQTSNGPDLVVLLSDTPADEDSWTAYDDGRTLLLGELKGNAGNQNYAIPSGTDLSRFRSVVIWCRRFTVGFGAAPLQGA